MNKKSNYIYLDDDSLETSTNSDKALRHLPYISSLILKPRC